MVTMDSPYLHSLTNYLHSHPHIGLLITFFIAFTESLPVIGAVIPGSVTMTAVGMLIGSGVMPLASTMTWAILGAFFGDFVGFWVGARYQQQLKTIWPFRNNPSWLARGEAFFLKHGGKSVVFGRFFGPARSAVPLIAGLMQMSNRRFIIAALPSATIWALIYICPGIFIGALSLELPPHMATKFILAILTIVAFSWVFFLLIHFFFKKIAVTIDRFSHYCWKSFNHSQKMRWIPRLLSYPELSHPHRQITLLLAVIFSALLTCWVYMDARWGIGLSRFNEPLFILFRSLRIHVGEIVMLLATMLGDKFVLIPAAGLIFLWLVWKRYFWTAAHWLGLTIVSAGLVEVLKRLYYSPRPPGLLHGSVDSSFPSGHTLLSVSLFGFMAILITQYLPVGKRKTPYVIAIILCLWISLSRLYLGAHWLTDILASIFLGLTLIFLTTLSYRSRPHQPLPYKRFTLVSCVILLLIWAVYGVSQFHTLRHNYTLSWQKISSTEEQWWNNQTADIPTYIVSRLGKPTVALNIQWLGNLNDIEHTLIAQGWETHPVRNNFKGAWGRLSAHNNAQHLPLLPALYQNRGPVLLLTKFDKNHQQLNLMLWTSNVILLNNSLHTLLLGNIAYYTPRPHEKSDQALNPQQLSILYEKALEQLMTDLKTQQFKIVQVPLNLPSSEMKALHWDGRILLIRNQPSPAASVN